VLDPLINRAQHCPLDDGSYRPNKDAKIDLGGGARPRRYGTQASALSSIVGFGLGSKMGLETFEAVGPYGRWAPEPVVRRGQALKLESCPVPQRRGHG